MTPSLFALLDDPAADHAALLRDLAPEDFDRLAAQAADAHFATRQAWQLRYFQAVNPRSLDVFRSTARQVIVKGGKRSSKTDTLLAELAIEMTGIVPESLKDIYPPSKLRPPIRARHMSESLTDTLAAIILPKLRWDTWSGTGRPGDLTAGHWGWIPRAMLRGGKWDVAYSEKHRTLSLVNGSTCSFFSYDQDPESGEGASLHLAIHDEPPPRAWYKVNQMRTLDVQGQVYTGYTPPTEPDRAVKAAWIFDEVVEPGLPGPLKDPQIDVFVLLTEGNRLLDPAAIAETVKGFNAVERQAILYGEETHLSGRIHPLFTDREQWYCLACGSVQIPVEGGHCPECLGTLQDFCHVVANWEVPTGWPCYFVMDPHERRPCAMSWYRVGPGDECVKQAEAWADGSVGEWKKAIEQTEKEIIGREPDVRLCDPNPLDATDNRQKRGWTLRRELSDHGIRVVAADDNFTVGRRRVDEALAPDPRTRRPRYTVMRRCERTIRAYLRYTWDEFIRREGREPKGKPREEHKHFPDCCSADTEILTQEGWTPFPKLSAGIPVATLSPAGRLEFQQPADYIEEAYDGPMVEIDAKAVNALVTPNHRMLVYPDGESPLSFRRAEDLRKGDRVPIGSLPEEPPNPLDRFRIGSHDIFAGDWAEFLGWYLAEGWARGTRGGRTGGTGIGYRTGISQADGAKADQIAALLRRLPWAWHRTGYDFIMSSRELWGVLAPLGASAGKRIPREALRRLSPEHKQRLWEAMVAGDGNRSGACTTYSTASPGLAEDITELLARMGKAASWTTRECSGGFRANYPAQRVLPRTTARASVGSTDHGPRFRTVSYTGSIYCVTVPNHTVLVRRNRKPVFIGNCDRYFFQAEPSYYISRTIWTPRKGAGRSARTGY